ncbi:MAG: hypothetical protein R3C12_18930 [Planctomycetaceae bacterium]
MRESGGIFDPSAYEKARLIVERDFPWRTEHLFPFSFPTAITSGRRQRARRDALVEHLLLICNLFCYGQVESPYGTGDYLRNSASCRNTGRTCPCR